MFVLSSAQAIEQYAQVGAALCPIWTYIFSHTLNKMKTLVPNSFFALFLAVFCVIPLWAQRVTFERPESFRGGKSDYYGVVGIFQIDTGSIVIGLRQIPSIHSFSVASDQDRFVPDGISTDRNYTMGIGFTWNGFGTNRYFLFGTPAMLEGLDWLVDRAIPLGCITDYSFTLGFAAFTPDSIGLVEPIPDDRPFACDLFFRSGRVYVSKNPNWAYRTDASWGLLGNGIAEFVQTAIHSGQRVHNPNARENPLGWHNQISNKCAISLQYNLLAIENLAESRRARCAGGNSVQCEVDNILRPPGNYHLNLTYGGGLGIYDYLKFGVSAKAGRYRGRFYDTMNDLANVSPAGGVPVNMPSYMLKDRTTGCSPNWHIFRFEWYFFGEADVSAWGYNAMLQGWNRSDDPQVFDRRSPFHYKNVAPLTLNFDVGAGIVLNRLTFKYAFMGRSPEFHTRLSNWHLWGQISMGYSII